MGYLGASRPEKLDQVSVSSPVIHHEATGFEGDSSKIILRPCVNRQMRLCDRNRPAYAPRFKRVERGGDHFGSHDLSGLDHSGLDVLSVKKPIVITLVKVNENKIQQ